MALDAEIERIRKDTEHWRALMRQLLSYAEKGVLSDWELDFLESNLGKRWLDELSYRQAESLLEIRDDVQVVSAYRGYSVKTMLQGVYENRLDLDDDGEEWVKRLYESGRNEIRRKDARRLIAIARRIGLIETDWAA
jgi:hypothetical protein